MKVLVTGVKGQLGHDCVNELRKRNHESIGVDIEEMDITDDASVESILSDVKPDAVIHCAAWTAIDAAEDEDKQEIVNQVNAVGTTNIANVCKSLNCKMMYISTDYVFNGQENTPQTPDCKDYIKHRETLPTSYCVNDQIGSPTYTYDLSRLLVDMIKTDKYSYYHATNKGDYISQFDFTKEIFRQSVTMGQGEYSPDIVEVTPIIRSPLLVSISTNNSIH